MNFAERRVGAELADGLAFAAERKWPIRYESIEAATICFDVATIALTSICAAILYPLSGDAQLDLGQAIGSSALVSVLFSLLLKSQGLYRPAELLMLRRQIRLVFATWAAVFL